MIIDFFFAKELSFEMWLVCLIVLIMLDGITILHILANKYDEPASAILWIFIVIDLPLLGIFFYLFLGINRLKTTAIKIDKVNKKMTDAKQEIEGGAFLSYIAGIMEFNYKSPEDSYMSLLDRLLPNTFPTTGNSINLLEDGTSAYPKMLDAIEKTKKHIHLQSFIINDDEIGNKIFDALERKSREEGVRVKVIFDRLGSSNAYSRHFFKKWSRNNKNFEVKAFSKFNLFAPYRIQLRNHRKLLICDGKVAFIGGINISSENDATLKAKYIHDLHCEVRGPSVGELQFAFLKDWSYVARIDPEILLEHGDYFLPPENMGESVLRVIPSGPGQSYEASKKLFMTAASMSKKSLWIITPYFVPDKSFIEAICLTAARGVDVKIIIPLNNNHWYVRYASRGIYDTIIRANIRVFEKKGMFSHAKAALIDGKWAIMGSSNCDMRSFRLNYELDFTVESGNFAYQLHRQFQKELAESQEVTYSDRLNISLYQRFLENLCSLFTPVL
ncbi:MAG TPA: cardiolipin synthase [Lentisphaeria bacterium]|nr:MAG: cardiolipin synthase [Lentisphaerae bacterium GWF2_38_69]HBM16305.1 cardiolipin synthase [Lentisphaeria bacterium]